MKTYVLLSVLAFTTTSFAADFCNELLCNRALRDVTSYPSNTVDVNYYLKTTPTCDVLQDKIVVAKKEGNGYFAYAYTKSGVYRFDLSQQASHKGDVTDQLLASKNKTFTAKLAIPNGPKNGAITGSESLNFKFFFDDKGDASVFQATETGLQNSADIKPPAQPVLTEKSQSEIVDMLKARIKTLPAEFSRKKDHMSYADAAKAQATDEKAALTACEKVKGLADSDDFKWAESNLPGGRPMTPNLKMDGEAPQAPNGQSGHQ